MKNQDCYRFSLDFLNGTLPFYDVTEFLDVLGTFSSKLAASRWVLAASGRYNYSRRLTLDGSGIFQIMFNPSSGLPKPIYDDIYGIEPDREDPGYDSYLTDCFRRVLPYRDHELAADPSQSNNPGIFLSISGDGIRFLHSIGGEQTSLNKLLFWLYEHGFKCTRFDVACDVTDPDNELVPAVTQAFRYFQYPKVGKPTVSTKIRRDRKNIRQYAYRDDQDRVFWNIELGNHGSEAGMFRMYNKFYEVRDGRLSEYKEALYNDLGVTDYWYRFEYELHKDNAAAVFNGMMQAASESNILPSYKDCFRAAYEKLFRVVSVPSLGYQVGRCPSLDVWDEFHEFLVEQSTLFILSNSTLPYVAMAKDRIHKFVKRNAGFLHAMLFALLEDSEFKREVLEEGYSKFMKNPRYNGLRDELQINFDKIAL